MPGSGSEMWETAQENNGKAEGSPYAPTLDFTDQKTERHHRLDLPRYGGCPALFVLWVVEDPFS